MSRDLISMACQTMSPRPSLPSRPIYASQLPCPPGSYRSSPLISLSRPAHPVIKHKPHPSLPAFPWTTSPHGHLPATTDPPSRIFNNPIQGHPQHPNPLALRSPSHPAATSRLAGATGQQPTCFAGPSHHHASERPAIFEWQGMRHIQSQSPI